MVEGPLLLRKCRSRLRVLFMSTFVMAASVWTKGSLEGVDPSAMSMIYASAKKLARCGRGHMALLGWVAKAKLVAKTRISHEQF